LQRFASLKDICSEISKVIDSMFTSEVSSEAHLPALIHKIVSHMQFPIQLERRSREVLLSRPSHVAASGADGCITQSSLKSATYEQASKQETHMHCNT